KIILRIEMFIVAQRNRTPQQLLRLCEMIALAKNESELSERVRVIRLECERAAQCRFGHIVCRMASRRDADEVVRFGHIRKTRSRALKNFERPFVKILEQIDAAEPNVVNKL